MKIEIFWDKYSIVEITRKDGKYINNMNENNIELAKSEGMPMILLRDIEPTSNKLPNLIMNRIPPKETRDKYLEFVSDNEAINIIEYIKSGKCSFQTDKFTVNLT